MNRSTRRQFLKSGGAVIATAILPTWGCDGNEVRFKSMPTGPDMDIMDIEEMPEEEALPLPPITSNARHYLQSIKGTNYDPRLAADSWRLVVDGLVDQPNRGWTYADITALPMNRQVLTMQCIGNWIGGPLVGNAGWGGTPLSEVLGLAGIKSGAIRVKFYSVDGYTTSIPLERALRDEVILAWEMNGEPLPSKHGFPLRLINPGHYGQKMPKWITRIELIDEVHLGHWESKPENKPFKWSDDAVATVNSRIDAPLSVWDDKKDPANGGVSRVLQTLRGAEGRPFTIHGIAMAGELTIESVEVSTNGGRSWAEAQITTQRLPNIWVTWAYEWNLPASGEYHIVVRATDSAGDRQPEEDAGADLYDGRTGWHRVPVKVASTAG